MGCVARRFLSRYVEMDIAILLEQPLKREMELGSSFFIGVDIYYSTQYCQGNFPLEKRAE